MTFDFHELAFVQKKLTGQLFDVIMMDPPWNISTKDPTRGVALSYKTLSNFKISTLPIDELQENGYLFLWTVNSRYSLCLHMMSRWGYKFCDEISWIKQSENGMIFKGLGHYLQHSKEICLVGIKGKLQPNNKISKMCDCIISAKRGQSQKPNEIYDMIESLVPKGYYLEIFGRRNNLRDGWITIGNEL